MATNGIPFEKNMTLCLISQEGDAAPFTAIEFIYPNSFLLNNNMWYSDVKMPSWVTAHIVSHDNIAWDDSDTVVLRLITAPKEVLDFPAVEILKYGEIVCYVERIYSGVKFSVEYECIAWAECDLEYPAPSADVTPADEAALGISMSELDAALDAAAIQSARALLAEISVPVGPVADVEYKYAPINRPVFEAAPEGWLRTLDPTPDMRETYLYGYVFYSRKLTMDEVQRYEFWPISDNARQFAIGDYVDYDELACVVKFYLPRGRYALEQIGAGMLPSVREIDLKPITRPQPAASEPSAESGSAGDCKSLYNRDQRLTRMFIEYRDEGFANSHTDMDYTAWLEGTINDLDRQIKWLHSKLDELEPLSANLAIAKNVLQDNALLRASIDGKDAELAAVRAERDALVKAVTHLGLFTSWQHLIELLDKAPIRGWEAPYANALGFTIGYLTRLSELVPNAGSAMYPDARVIPATATRPPEPTDDDTGTDLVDVVTGYTDEQAVYAERSGRPDSDDDLLTADDVRGMLFDGEPRHIGD